MQTVKQKNEHKDMLKLNCEDQATASCDYDDIVLRMHDHHRKGIRQNPNPSPNRRWARTRAKARLPCVEWGTLRHQTFFALLRVLKYNIGGPLGSSRQRLLENTEMMQ